jgi:hypothetical protein
LILLHAATSTMESCSCCGAGLTPDASKQTRRGRVRLCGWGGNVQPEILLRVVRINDQQFTMCLSNRGASVNQIPVYRLNPNFKSQFRVLQRNRKSQNATFLSWGKYRPRFCIQRMQTAVLLDYSQHLTRAI